MAVLSILVMGFVAVFGTTFTQIILERFTVSSTAQTAGAKLTDSFTASSTVNNASIITEMIVFNGVQTGQTQFLGNKITMSACMTQSVTAQASTQSSCFSLTTVTDHAVTNTRTVNGSSSHGPPPKTTTVTTTTTTTTTTTVINNKGTLSAAIIAALLICFVLVAVLVAKRR